MQLHTGSYLNLYVKFVCIAYSNPENILLQNNLQLMNILKKQLNNALHSKPVQL